MSNPPNPQTTSNNQSTKPQLPGGSGSNLGVWWWGILLLGGLLVGSPFVLSRSPSANEIELANRREQIANLSATDRERLEKNFARFQKLPPEDQERLRQLNKAVANQPELKKSLSELDRWLATLSPWERAEFRKANSVAEKLAVVNAVVTERREMEAELRRQEEDWKEHVKKQLAQSQWRRPEGTRLSESDLTRMLSVLEADFASEVKLNKYSQPGCAAYNIQLLALALKANLAANPETAREMPLPDSRIEAMIAQVSNSEVRIQLEKMHEKYHSKGMVYFLSVKLQSAWWNEANPQIPSHLELDEIAQTLGGKALEDFEKEKEDDPRRAYYNLLKKMRSATFVLDTKELFDVMSKLGMRRFSFRPGPPPGGRPNTGRPENGGPRKPLPKKPPEKPNPGQIQPKP